MQSWLPKVKLFEELNGFAKVNVDNVKFRNGPDGAPIPQDAILFDFQFCVGRREVNRHFFFQKSGNWTYG